MPVRDVSRLKLPDVLFWLLAGMSAVLLVVLALILSGVIPVDPASESTARSRMSSSSRRRRRPSP